MNPLATLIRRLLPARLVLLIAFLVTSAHAQLTWTEQTSGATDQLRDVWAADATNIWVVGAGGRILKGDGSGTWTAQTSGVTNSLIEVWGTSATNVWAVGSGGRVLRWNGTTWLTQTSGTTSPLFSLWGSSATNVWAGGEFGTLTRWNGTSWTASSLGVGVNMYCNGIWGTAANNIWMVGANFNTGNGMVYRYNGTSWSPDTSMGTVAGLNDVWGTDANNVWAVGVGGLILRWNGTAWSTVTSGTTQELLSVWGTSATNVYATSAEGGIFRFDGTSWTKDSYSSIERLNSVMGTSANSVYIAGGSFQVATILAGAPAAVPTAPPTVTTTLPGTIGSTTVVMGGNVTADGGGSVLERGIVWGTAANPTTANNKFPIGTGMGSFSGTVTGLPPTRTVFARAFARNSLFTGYGEDTSFTTLSNNADLSALTTTAGTLSPAFATGTTSYTTPNVANGITSVTVTPTRAAATSMLQVRVNGGTYATVTSGSASVDLPLNVGSNTINVLVTAEDTATTKAYTLTVTRAAPVLAGDPITPTAVIVTSQWVGPDAGVKENIINGTGLSGGGSVLTQTHDELVTANTMWHAGPNAGGISGGVTGPPLFGAPPVNTQAVEFDLGANYDLSGAHIWNMNQAGNIGRGVKDVQILLSSTTTGAFTALTTTQFTQGTGAAGLAAQVVPLTGATNVRRVRFSIQTAWSGAASDYVGLSEVRFQGALATIANAAPVLVSHGVLPATISANHPENTPVVIGVIGVTDADTTQTHNWALSGADAGKFQIVAHPSVVGGFQVLFTTAPDFENPTDVGADNVYEVTITATDSGSPALSDSVAFILTVTDENDAPPTLSEIAAQTTNEDTAAVIPFTVGDDAGQDLDILEFQITGDNATLIPAGNIVLGGSGANRTLTITPAANLSGSAVITLLAIDGFLSAERTFTLTVNPVNDAPTFTLAENITRFPGSGAYSQAGVVSAISRGPADENGQTISLSLPTVTNPTLFTVAPTLTAAGTLRFTPGNTAGTSTVTVRAQDNGGTARGGVNFTQKTFTIAISSLAVTFADVTMNEDSTLPVSPASASGAAGQVLSKILSSSNPALFPVDLNATPAATVTLTPAPNQSGTAVITVASKDNFATVINTFTVTVNPVNDAPSFSFPTLRSWTVRDSQRSWSSITSSADGSKLAAVVNGGQIYTSTDSGLTWEARMTDANRKWTSITSSADGSKLAAVVSGGEIYTSTDSGVNWINRSLPKLWRKIISSADGNKLVALSSTSTDGSYYFSNDSGVTWGTGNIGYNDGVFLLKDISSSADGRSLVALGSSSTHTSYDSVWSTRHTTQDYEVAFGIGGEAITSSADGSKLAMINDGAIFTRSPAANSSLTRFDWTQRVSNQGFVSITSSADGSKIAASGSGVIYTSSDFGVTWTRQAYSPAGGTITSSADGDKLAMIGNNGFIYTSDGGNGPIVSINSGVYTQEGFVVNTAGPANESTQTVSFTVTTTNGSLFAVPPAIAPNGTLTFTPSLNAGNATVTVRAVDTGGTANGGMDTSSDQTFTITVNKPLKLKQPSFLVGLEDLLASQSRSTPEGRVDVLQVTSQSNGVDNNLPITLSGADSSHFTLVPGTSSGLAVFDLNFNTTPNFEAKLDANSDGIYEITVSVGTPGTPLGMDTANFSITVADVNEMPSFTKGANVTNIPAIVAPQIIPGWATAINDGDALATQGLTFTFTPVSQSNRLSVGPAIDPATGNLTFTPSGITGTARYRVKLTDDASINGTAALTTAEQTFDLVFTAVPAGTGTAEFTAWPALATLPADQRGPNATPANDGVSNLLKFALGIGPLDSANGFIPQGVTQGSGTAADFPTISFIRKKGLAGVAVDVEIAASLEFTTRIGAAITGIQDLGNGTERVTVRSTAPYTGNASQFFRLKATAD